MDKTVWVVRWRGFEEECAGRRDALDRWGQLDAQGIQAEVLEIAGPRQVRCLSLVDTRRFAGPRESVTRATHGKPRHRGGGA